MHRTSPGAFGRLRPQRGLPRVIALGIVTILVAACGTTATEAKFALSIRNGGEQPIKLKVLVASQGRPSHDLLIPAKSGILQTAEQPMDVADGKPVPVDIEVYTDTCALLTTVSVGEGRSGLVIGDDFSVTISGGAPDPGAGGVEPEQVTPC